MGHSRAEKAQSRERIIATAARRVREGGLESLGIAELMRDAGLTHGGFYGHFASREALLAAAVARALDESEGASRDRPRTPDTLRDVVRAYLSPAHRDDPGGGCVIAALSSELGRPAYAVLRPEVARRVDVTLERLEALLADAPEPGAQAMAIYALMVGALTLARITADRGRSDAILRAACDAALALAAAPADTTHLPAPTAGDDQATN